MKKQSTERRQPIEQEQILANDTCDEGLTHNVHEVLLQSINLLQKLAKNLCSGVAKDDS